MTDDAYARLIQNASAASGRQRAPRHFRVASMAASRIHWTSGILLIAASSTFQSIGTAAGFMRARIKRQELVSLFAGLLRREEDGGYYLVTPVEKVEVDVALHPLMVVDAAPMVAEEGQVLALVLNTGGIFKLDAETGLQPEDRRGCVLRESSEWSKCAFYASGLVSLGGTSR